MLEHVYAENNRIVQLTSAHTNNKHENTILLARCRCSLLVVATVVATVVAVVLL